MFDIFSSVYHANINISISEVPIKSISQKGISWAGLIITSTTTVAAYCLTNGEPKKTFSVMGTSAAMFIAAYRFFEAMEDVFQ